MKLNTIFVDIALQNEHDRKVAAAAVAAARLEWEKQLQQQQLHSSPKPTYSQQIQAPVPTVIHSGK